MSIRIASSEYVLQRDGGGWSVDIPYTYRNQTADMLYAMNCNGAISVGVEQRDGDAWKPFWSQPSAACLSAPIVIAPGESSDRTLHLRGAAPGKGITPEFPDTTFTGTYRIVWWHLNKNFDAGKGGVGDTIPARYRVSRQFRLVR